MTGFLEHFDKQFPSQTNLDRLSNHDMVTFNFDKDKNKIKDYYDSLNEHIKLNPHVQKHVEITNPKSHEEYNDLINKLKINNVADINTLTSIKKRFTDHLNKIQNKYLKRKHTGEHYLYPTKKTK
jgi:hypothetical protein